MKKILCTLFAVASFCTVTAQTCLFHTGDEKGVPYRIPAIVTAKNGDVVALSDIRPCGNDIGYGRVDILQRVSKDNGKTWSDVETVLEGSGKGEDCGYGDACLVADRCRNELLLVCVSGDVPYWQSKINHKQRIVCTHAKYNKKTQKWEWEKHPKDLTEMVYHDLLGDQINGLFMGSGRICQSTKIKVGKYYRIYGALCTHKGNYVIYSDDFGYNWKVLGSNTESCARYGDEPKCLELPDGSVLLSSRKDNGRFFNIFRYTDEKLATGTWGAVVASDKVEGGIKNSARGTNGEVLILDAVRTNDKKPVKVVLQSVPAGPGRTNVTIYWKEIHSQVDYLTPLAFAKNWNGSFLVTDKGSAYSCMTLQRDNTIGFFYEEEPNYYQMMYKRLTLEEITNGDLKLK